MTGVTLVMDFDQASLAERATTVQYPENSHTTFFIRWLRMLRYS